MLAAIALHIACLAGSAHAQAGALNARVLEQGTRRPVAYATVTVGASRHVFTNDSGWFRIESRGPQTRLQIRHLGYAALDTVVDTGRDGSVFFLARLPARLDSITSVGERVSVRLAPSCPVSPDPQRRAALMVMLEQMVLSGDQYRLFVDAHPFATRFADSTVTRMTDGRINVRADSIGGIEVPRHFVLTASARSQYVPAKVFRTSNGATEVFVPQIQDLTDEQFLAKHCFTLGSDTMLGATRVVRIQFAPIPELHDADVEGTVYFSADPYRLAALELRTTGELPRRAAKDIASVTITAFFRDVVPGIAILSRLESFLTPGPEARQKNPDVESRGEIQQVMGVLWKHGPPH